MRDFMIGLVDRQQGDVLVRSQPGRLIEVTTPMGKVVLGIDDAEAVLASLPEAIENARRSVDE